MKNACLFMLSSILSIASLSLADMRSLSTVPSPDPNAIFYPNPGVIDIVEPGTYTNVVAMAGPRGMYKNFYSLLLGTNLISDGGMWRGGKSLLLIEGNFIGQGPDNVAVINFIILLTQQAKLSGGQVVVLLGEEEARLLADPVNYKNDGLKADLKKLNLTATQFISPVAPVGVTTPGTFLRSLPIAAKIGHWLFISSGLYPEVTWPQFSYVTKILLSQDKYSDKVILGSGSVLTAKDWWKDPKIIELLSRRLIFNNFAGVVFGNQNQAFGQPTEIRSFGGRFIKIDVGMGPDEGSNPGRLLIFPVPKQMESMGFPTLKTMGPSGQIVPLPLN